MGMRHLFLDFFGTLVNYSDSRVEQGYDATHASMRALGSTGDEQQTERAWSDAFHQLNQETDVDQREFSMEEVSRRALVQLLDREPDDAEISQGTTSHMADWELGVVLIPGMADTLRELSRTFTLTIVSNTHNAAVVPRQLAAMAATEHITHIVTSLEVGFRKPHPAIYRAALNRADAAADEVIFVGDTWLADFDGPRANGMDAVLVAASPRDGVPENRRVSSVLELPSLLGIAASAAS